MYKNERRILEGKKHTNRYNQHRAVPYSYDVNEAKVSGGKILKARRTNKIKIKKFSLVLERSHYQARI